MQKISIFITSVIGIILISVIIENLSPEKYKKYIKFAIGLIIMIVVASSFFNLLSLKYEVNLDDFVVENDLQNNLKNDYNTQIKRLFAQNLKSEIENNIRSKIDFTCEVFPEISDDLSKISLKIKCNEKHFNTIEKFINNTYEIGDIAFIKEVITNE